MLENWVTALCAELELDPAVIDVPLVLDIARDAAHGVERPAAPLTTFLVGWAAARAGGSQDDVRAAAVKAARLASSWEPREPREPREHGEPSGSPAAE